MRCHRVGHGHFLLKVVSLYDQYEIITSCPPWGVRTQLGQGADRHFEVAIVVVIPPHRVFGAGTPGGEALRDPDAVRA